MISVHFLARTNAFYITIFNCNIPFNHLLRIHVKLFSLIQQETRNYFFKNLTSTTTLEIPGNLTLFPLPKIIQKVRDSVVFIKNRTTEFCFSATERFLV